MLKEGWNETKRPVISFQKEKRTMVQWKKRSVIIDEILEIIED